MVGQNGKYSKLKKITFTGIDEKTDIDELIALSRDYPKVEYGFLAHENYQMLGNLFCSPWMLHKMKDAGLTLSLHICGELAKRVFATGDWNEIIAYMQGSFSLFDRIQLNNIRKADILDKKWKLSIPTGISEIIIQQHSADNMSVYQHYLDNRADISGNFTMLLDASGGRGERSEKLNTLNLPYVGYAGGLGPDNVRDIVQQLENSENVQDYWIDMQKHVRDENDWFSVELCRRVCNALEQI